MHPTASWRALNRPDGTAELVTMDHGSPTRVSLGAGERVFCWESTERLWLADRSGYVDVRILIHNGERWETLHEVTAPGALTSLTTDVSHAVISTEGGLQSLTVASGSRPEVLPVETESQPFIEYPGQDHLLFRETVSDDFGVLSNRSVGVNARTYAPNTPRGVGGKRGGSLGKWEGSMIDSPGSLSSSSWN